MASATWLTRQLCATALIATAACGGGSGSGSGSSAGDGSSSQGFSSEYVPPRYEWSPGTPGRAVGIHAVATIGGEEQRSAELEIELLEASEHDAPAARSTALTSAGGARAASAALCSTELRESTTAFETINDKICWTTFGTSGGALGAGGSFASYLIFTREGTYAAPFASMDVYVPPDLVNISDIVSVGCLVSDDGQVPVEYLNGMSALSVSATFTAPIVPGPLSLKVGNGAGFSVFRDTSKQWARAFQYDTNLATIAISLIPFPVELRAQTMSGFRRDPWLYRKSDNICVANRNPFDPDEATPKALTFAAPSSDPNDQLREAAEELIAPLMRHLASEEGFGPAPHMMAGSNADAFTSFGGPGLGASADDSSPASTLDDLVSGVASEIPDAENNQEIASIMARRAQDLANILPSPVLLDTLLRNAAAGIELANDAAFATGADYRGEGLIRIDAAVGELVVLDFEASELAALLGVDEAAVIGATLHLSATHTVSASEHVLEGPLLSLSFTPERSIPLVVKVRVDLSTAAGPFDASLDGVEPRLTPRLIVPEAGAPEQLALSAAGRVTAGGAITLNAVVTDASGNPSPEPVAIELFDGEGRSLGTVTSEHGVATLQYVPTASSPKIDRVVPTELTREDETFPGIEVLGSGFSVDAEILIDGEPIADQDIAYNVRSSSSILIALDAEPGTTIEIANPGGASAGPAEVER